MLQEVDHIPLGGRLVGKKHTTEREAPPIEREVARAPRVVRQRCGKHRGRAEAQRIPARRGAGDDEPLAAQKGSQKLSVASRSLAEATLHGGVEQPVCRLPQLSFANETSCQARGARAPAPQLSNAVGPSGVEVGLCFEIHGRSVLYLPQETPDKGRRMASAAMHGFAGGSEGTFWCEAPDASCRASP